MREEKSEKDEIRRRIWDEMLLKGIARLPLPLHNRIPNFKGAEKAAFMLTSLKEWKNARVVKINPDSPQRYLREKALKSGKTLIMPTPRIKKGFLIIDPKVSNAKAASTIKGAFRHGRILSIDELREIEIDFIVEGSVAVNPLGERLGKGEGYGELEFAILLELGAIDGDVPIATTIHEIQLLEDKLPQEPHDVPVDYIATPMRILKTERGERPKGILWHLLEKRKLDEIPLLQKLKSR